MWHGGRDERFKRAALGVMFGFLALLALRGAQEVYIDHAQTMRMYRADPERFLASHGWTADSSMARQYVRRISQPEASGWFGLSNVYASFAVFGTVAAAGWVIGAAKSRRGLGWALAAAALCGFALFLSQSKGGVAFAGFGIGLLAIGWLFSRVGNAVPPLRGSEPTTPATGGLRPRLTLLRRCAAMSIGPLCIFGVLAAIAVRGVVGERIGELSILFRAFISRPRCGCLATTR